MKVIPVDENGAEIDEDNLDYIENPQQLLDRRVDYCLKIEDVNFKEAEYRDTYCEYHILTSKGIETCRTEKVIDSLSF